MRTEPYTCVALTVFLWASSSCAIQESNAQSPETERVLSTTPTRRAGASIEFRLTPRSVIDGWFAKAESDPTELPALILFPPRSEYLESAEGWRFVGSANVRETGIATVTDVPAGAYSLYLRCCRLDTRNRQETIGVWISEIVSDGSSDHRIDIDVSELAAKNVEIRSQFANGSTAPHAAFRLRPVDPRPHHRGVSLRTNAQGRATHPLLITTYRVTGFLPSARGEPFDFANVTVGQDEETLVLTFPQIGERN